MSSSQITPKPLQIAAAVIGNALEWYDFIVFGFFTVIIARLFFPGDPNAWLISNKFHKQIQHPWALAQTSRRGACFNLTFRWCQRRKTADFGRDFGPIDPRPLSTKPLHFPRLIGNPCR